MLAANVCSADFIARAKHPALYRVHEGPTPEKKTLLQNYLQARSGWACRSATIRSLPSTRRSPRRPRSGPTRRRSTRCCCARCSRRSTPSNEHRPLRPRVRGLHALHEPDPPLSRPAGAPRDQGAAREPALSDRRPTRRASRRRRRALAKAAKTAKNARPGAAALPPLAPGGELEAWEIAGAHCSANERRADEASRDVEAWLKCRYMREHLGEEYGGAVSAVTSFGIFVHARRPLRRRAGPHHRARRRVLPLRRGAPGAARRAHRASATSSARASAFRSAASTWTDARSTSASFATARTLQTRCARGARRRPSATRR